MVDTVEVTGKVDDVLHDGTNMIVLRKHKSTTVAKTSVPFLLSKSAIEDVELEVVAAVFEFGVGNGGDGTDASEVGAKADGLQVALIDGLAGTDPALDHTELVELRQRVIDLDQECDTLATERLAISNERDDLQRQLAEARETIAGLDRDGDGNAGGSKPADPPALTGKNKADLLAIAVAEKVEIKEGATNAEIVEAIEAARAGEDEAPAA